MFQKKVKIVFSSASKTPIWKRVSEKAKIIFSSLSKTLILRPEYLTTDGVYRQSGNLSVVQRLRLQIDQGNLGVLDTVDDVHVLTGALKLFFRELQEPLVPWEVVCSFF